MRAAFAPSEPPVPPGPTAVAPTYAAAWQDFRRRRRAVWIIWLTYLPGAGGVAALGQRVVGSGTPGIVVAVMWMAAFLASGLRVGAFRCPRCGERFTSRGGPLFRVNNPFTGKCLHCGVRVGEEPAGERPPAIV